MKGTESATGRNGGPEPGLRRTCFLRVGLMPAVLTIWLVAALAGPAEAGTRELDPVEVFCAFHALSGERPGDRDIEDLCWNTGRPTFSAFKPAEMFSRRALEQARRNLAHRSRSISADTIFRWDLGEVLTPRSGRGYAFRRGAGPHDLPQAGPMIQAEIPPQEWRRLEQVLERLPVASPAAQGSGREPRVGLLLRPVRVKTRDDNRNIAQMDVNIPVRFVVFRPVAVETRTGAEKTLVSIPLK